MGLFSKSSSTALTQVEDSRITGVEGSLLAQGGGAVVRLEQTREVETIPQAALGSIVDALSASDQRRSEDASKLVLATLETVKASREQDQATTSQALGGVLAQRQSETETLAGALERLQPIALAVVAVLGLWLLGGARR